MEFSCQRFDLRLHQLLDQHQHPEEDTDLLEHASQCDDCAETFRIQARLTRTLRADRWRFEPTRFKSTDYVAGALGAAKSVSRDGTSSSEKQATTPGQRWIRGWTITKRLMGATAGSILVWIAFSSLSQPLAKSTRISVHRNVRTRSINLPQSWPSVSEPADRASLTVLTPRTPPEESKWLARIEARLGLSSTQIDSSIQSFAGGLRPVKSSFSSAVQILRQSMRSTKESHDDKQPQSSRGLIDCPL